VSFKPDFRVILYLFAAFTVCSLLIVGSYVKTQELEAERAAQTESLPEKSEMLDI